MAMTKIEKIARKAIIDRLKDEHSFAYVDLLKKLEFNFTEDPGVVAFFEPSKGRIVANVGLDEDQVCVIIRHEILHWYLLHEQRMIDHLAKEMPIDKSTDELRDASINNIKKVLYGNSDFNYAGDYEISNRAYSEEDKDVVRKIILNGQLLKGLVTEDDHPEWVNLPLEDMYDKLRAERKKAEQEAKKQMKDSDDVVNGALADPVTFVGVDGVVYGI